MQYAEGVLIPVRLQAMNGSARVYYQFPKDLATNPAALQLVTNSLAASGVQVAIWTPRQRHYNR